MPLQRRIPKFGFKNINRVEYQPVNLGKIQELFDNKKIKKVVGLNSFIDNGFANKTDLIKVLGNGKLTVPLKISAHKFSKSAQKAIEKAGGEVITI